MVRKSAKPLPPLVRPRPTFPSAKKPRSEAPLSPALKAGQKSSMSQHYLNVLLEPVRNLPSSASPTTTKLHRTTRVFIHRPKLATSEKKSKSTAPINTAVKLSSLNKTLIDAIDTWKWSATRAAKSANSLKLLPRPRPL